RATVCGYSDRQFWIRFVFHARNLMATTSPSLAFDLSAAKAALAAKDERIARLIEETYEFQLKMEAMDSPYESLMRSIAYQSISGKAAATIFARVKTLGWNGGGPKRP